MNPPFSALANVSGRVADAAYRHIASALARLADGGRLVAITGANFGPDLPAWRDAFVRLQERGTIVFTAAIDGSVYAKHGTSIDTRLTVIDKCPAADPALFPASAGIAPDVATLLGWIERQVPARLAVARPAAVALAEPQAPRTVRGYLARAAAARPARLASIEPEGVELAYETVDWTPPEGARLTDAIYEEYTLQSIRVSGAQPHPTKLVQSAAMASVAPPKPSYRPMLPANIVANGLLSDAQLETIIYAGEAHDEFLAGSWTVDETFDLVSAAPEGAGGAVRFRRGFMLGDGTGAGKGRQSAGIILDNWLRGRRKAVWISKSDKPGGCPARRRGARHGATSCVATLPIPAGQAHHASRRHPIYNLCHATLRRPWREGFARPANRRLVGLRLGRSAHFRREPRDAERRRRQGRTG
jgi:hypothetical protein